MYTIRHDNRQLGLSCAHQAMHIVDVLGRRSHPSKSPHEHHGLTVHVLSHREDQPFQPLRTRIAATAIIDAILFLGALHIKTDERPHWPHFNSGCRLASFLKTTIVGSQRFRLYVLTRVSYRHGWCILDQFARKLPVSMANSVKKVGLRRP